MTTSTYIAKTNDAGLNEPEARIRLERFGANEIASDARGSNWKQFLHILKEPMLMLLLGAAAIYFVMGDSGEGLLLGLSACFVIGISLYQNVKSARALEALRDLSSPRALVIREGIQKRVPSREVVPGDLIALNEGDRVPADAVVISSQNLTVDESLLTGESMSVRKTPIVPQSDGGESENVSSATRVYSSTLIVGGRGVAVVVSTGGATEVGRLGTALKSGKSPGKTYLSREIRSLVKLFGIVGLIVCVVMVGLYGFLRGDWLQALLGGLAVAMSLLPEEFPVVLTIFLAMGAWRLTRSNVLVRAPEAIERLGAISALCVDKTGTLTENKMRVAVLSDGKRSVRLACAEDRPDAEFREILEYGMLASPRGPIDPMEKAIHRLSKDAGLTEVPSSWNVEREYELSDRFLAVTNVWKSTDDSGTRVVAIKGAPETILGLCGITDATSSSYLAEVRKMAADGFRALGVAKADWAATRALPENPDGFGFKFLGFLGFEDPLRPEVPRAVERCHGAGIRVIMMTGDYPETARKIAMQAGLRGEGEVETGRGLAEASGAELTERIKRANVFARMRPEQKQRVVEALQAEGFVVGMTGDGVNDAPSLRRADVGIAMGARGTDVARESADLVLVDDNFASIVSGIERGRVIFSNIRKALSYLSSIHVPLAGLALLPLFFGWPLILLPIHIVFLELIIDPSCSLLFETQEPADDVMKVAPRSLGQKLFARADIQRSVLQGGALLAATILSFAWTFESTGDASRARAATFMVLVLSNVALIAADLGEGSLRRTRAIFTGPMSAVIVVLPIFLLALTLAVPPLRNVFSFGVPSPAEISRALGISVVIWIGLSFWNRKTERVFHR